MNGTTEKTSQDQSAKHAAIDANYAAMLRYARSRLNDADAQDAVHDAVASFLMGEYDGSEDQNAEQWLIRLTHCRTVDLCQRNTRHPVDSLDVGDERGSRLADELTDESAVVPGAALEQAELVNATLAAIAAEIAERDTQEGRLYAALFVEGLDAEQAAETCGTTRERVYDAKHRGARRIRRRVERAFA